MDTILALREKRKNLWDAAKAFLDTARDENGMVSAEDAARYDKMEADVVNLGKEIDRLERQQQLDAQLSQPTTMPITELPGAGQNGAEKKGKNRPNGKSKRKAVKRNDSDSDNEFEGNDREPDAFK